MIDPIEPIDTTPRITEFFPVNGCIGMDGRELRFELYRVACETRRRQQYRLTIEDQRARERNLRDARARLN